MIRSIELTHPYGNLVPMSYCRGMSLSTHILYVDDILIFFICTRSKRNIRCLLRIFRSYSDASGQLVYYNKNKFFIGAMTTTHRTFLSKCVDFWLELYLLSS